ncbi:MAG: ABC transporter ATP-binding protein [Bacteroidales bacterium]|nr:ABC transporter ATP-binding protein [Bacteroidales bacterium]
MNAIALDIHNLKKTYAGASTPAVNQLSLNVKAGAIHGLLGPNGAGKTSTISIVAGIAKFEGGSVQIFDYPLKTDIQSIRKLIGYVPQDIAIYPQLTAVENLIFFGRLHDLPIKILKNNIDDLLQALGLFEKRHEKTKHFSGGMKRRINLIAGLLHQPKLLILDEPTVGIDVQSKQAILSFLQEINRQGTTILYTSHMMDEAEKLCHFVSIIDQGKVIEEGTPDQLKQKFNQANLEDVFIHLTGKTLRD